MGAAKEVAFNHCAKPVEGDKWRERPGQARYVRGDKSRRYDAIGGGMLR